MVCTIIYSILRRAVCGIQVYITHSAITEIINVECNSALCFPLGIAQFQTCYDNAAANCGGNVVTGVSTTLDCCLGNGYWFQDTNLGCMQCIGE